MTKEETKDLDLDYDDLSPQDMDEILIGRGECLKVYMLHDVLRVIEDYEMDEDDKKDNIYWK
ncbi:hypothetical protein [Parageobacillus sp. G301]|jgi:hypothetical protein|uniref:hypothetical protein n=1 Tax=Parageobacillus sp. G301 TaxID=2998290 RepID=UPI002556CDCD|nr:hypothetical protein [Parageobacillus sp. G301]